MSGHDREDLIIRVLETLAEDILANADISPRSTVVGRRPLLVLPEDCPVLWVGMVQKVLTPRTTNDFDSAIAVQIVWWEEAVEQLKTLVEDQALARDMLRTVGRIERRLRVLANQGWDVPEAYDLFPTSLDYQPPPEIASGAVEGYSLTVQVNVTQKGT